MKKNLFAFLCVIVIASIMILVSTQFKSNPNVVFMDEVNLENIKELIIGSEPPKLLYADTEKIIFNCNGVYVYDMKDKILTRSFDPLSIDSSLHGKEKWNSFVSQDGQYIIFHIGMGNSNGSVGSFSYSFEDDLITKISENDYMDYRNNMFECSYLEYKDDLYEKASGRIVYLSDKEYVYLTFYDWKVSTIQVVYVKDSVETKLNVFEF